MKWIEEVVKRTLFKEIFRFQNIKEDGMRIFRRNDSLLQAIALPEEESFAIAHPHLFIQILLKGVLLERERGWYVVYKYHDIQNKFSIGSSTIFIYFLVFMMHPLFCFNPLNQKNCFNKCTPKND